MDIGDSFQGFTDALFEWLPRLVGALVILVIFWLIAKAVAKLLGNVLPRTGMDRAVHSGSMGRYVAHYASGFRPSAVLASLAYWFILLTGVVLALSTLGIQALNNAIEAVVGYLPHVVAAILILVVALAFGLGGRAAAERLMEGAYERGREAMPQAREEMAIARERARERADEARERVEGERARAGAGTAERGPGDTTATR